MRRSALIVLAGLAGCSSEPLGGVKASVRFLDTDAQCARVFVTGSTTAQVQTSGPLPRTGTDRVVGISQNNLTGGAVEIEAKGYLAADCSGTPIDFSKIEQREFFAGRPSAPVLLVLRGGATPDGGVDGGGPVDGGADGGPIDGGPGDGGPDGGPEQCGNGVDDDQDGLIDCFDGDCLKQDCNFGRRCTSIGVCEVPAAELLCGDGQDDDQDGQTDCADLDCDLKSCDDKLSCTYGDRCQSKLCTPQATQACVSPGECQTGLGICLPDAGCTYQPRAGSCDGGLCAGGECIIGFPFLPSNGFLPVIPSSAIVPKVTLNCGASTFNSDTLSFGNWCSQSEPKPQIINRAGVQNIVVLPMYGLVVQGELRLSGDRPVLLAIYGDATISGKLVASASGPLHGPGGPAGNCLLQGAPGTAFITSAVGGGGAGFSQAGTNGGKVTANPLVPGALGGGLFLPTPQLLLRGGCAGSDGASGVSGQQAALGGGAGGALQLSVSGTLTVDGKISANGGGGEGGVTINAGGGGGGSGGGILLEANLIKLLGTARITAHGGGGGGGAKDSTDGTDGADGHDNDSNAAAGGNRGGSEAGNGGNGGSTADPTAATDGTTSAGGGGGGGAGRIHLRSIAPCTVTGGWLVSPAATGGCP